MRTSWVALGREYNEGREKGKSDFRAGSKSFRSASAGTVLEVSPTPELNYTAVAIAAARRDETGPSDAYR